MVIPDGRLIPTLPSGRDLECIVGEAVAPRHEVGAVLLAALRPTIRLDAEYGYRPPARVRRHERVEGYGVETYCAKAR